MTDYWEPPFRGLVHVTGEPDTGKTTLCLTVPGVKPEHTYMLDDDLKSRGLAVQFEKSGHPFWDYVDLTTQFKEFAVKNKKSKPLDYYFFVYEKVQSTLTKILKGEREQPRALIFDNWSRMEPAIRAYSETIMSNISDLTPGQQKNMSMMTWGYTYEEYSRFLGELLKIAPLVFITTHIKEKWGSPGVLESRGQRPLVEKSSLRIWLRHNPAGPQPIGLVLKRVQRMLVTEQGIEPVNVLPRKITPCTWARIYDYFEHPVGDRKLTADEMPNEFELSILDGTLTADQKNALKLAANQQRQDDEETLNAINATAELEMATKVKELKADGLSLPDIVKQFNGSVTIAQVAKWLNQ